MSSRLKWTGDPVAIAIAKRSFPNPPTGDGGNVEAWSANPNNGSVDEFELHLLAGGDVTVSNAVLLAEEVADTYPEESNAVTAANATEKFTYVAHGFLTGDGPIRFSGDTLPDTISADAEYYVIKTAANDFKVATSRANALAGTGVAFATDGSNVLVHWVTSVKSRTQAASAIDATANTYTIVGHGLDTGEVVQLDNNGGAVPTGLLADTDYYAIAVDVDTLQFAATLKDALAGTAINWSAGSGTQYVTRDLEPTEATVFSSVVALNEGDPFDLSTSITFRDRYDHRPEVVAYHLVCETDSPVPLTAYARGLTLIWD